MTVGRLLEEIGSAELTEWMAFARREPFGGPIDDFRAGLGPSVTLNMHRAPGAAMIGPGELFPWYSKPEPDSVESAFDAVFGMGAKRG
jgi:hypothetical protein